MFAWILALSLLFSPISEVEDPPWYTSSEFPIAGEATYYAPGLMRWVYEYRIRRGHVPVCDPPQCVGYVATLRPGDLGRKVWLKPPGRPAEGPFLVVDYAAHKDFERLQARGLVAEVDYETALRWGTEAPNLSAHRLPERSRIPYRTTIPKQHRDPSCDTSWRSVSRDA